jgi:hypothetical protein
LVGAVDKLHEVGSGLRFDIAILESDKNVKANVVFLMTATFCQLILLDVLHDLSRPYQSCHFENLIDGIVSHQKGCLFKYLGSYRITIPAIMRPAAQVSTR